jgi:hypothetical protein
LHTTTTLVDEGALIAQKLLWIIRKRLDKETLVLSHPLP